MACVRSPPVFASRNRWIYPFSDYIVGSPEGSLQSEAALGDLVEQVSRSLDGLTQVSSAASSILGL